MPVVTLPKNKYVRALTVRGGGADHHAPMFSPQLLGEPGPEKGRLKVGALDAPGFGVELNRNIAMHRPYTH